MASGARSGVTDSDTGRTDGGDKEVDIVVVSGTRRTEVGVGATVTME